MRHGVALTVLPFLSSTGLDLGRMAFVPAKLSSDDETRGAVRTPP